MAKKVYAVKKGLKTGIFSTWEECKKQVHGFPGAQYKSFPTMQEAEAYLGNSENLISQPEQDEDACIAYVTGVLMLLRVRIPMAAFYCIRAAEWR